MTAGCSTQSTSSWRAGSGIAPGTVSSTSVRGHGAVLPTQGKKNVINKNWTVRSVVLVGDEVIFFHTWKVYLSYPLSQSGV